MAFEVQMPFQKYQCPPILVRYLLKIKFIYSEKATKICEVSTVDLSYVVPVKSTVEISKFFLAFSEYMNFMFADAIKSGTLACYERYTPTL